jgi:hypothetical protein
MTAPTTLENQLQKYPSTKPKIETFTEINNRSHSCYEVFWALKERSTSSIVDIVPAGDKYHTTKRGAYHEV